MAIKRPRRLTERDTPYMTHVHCSPPGTDPGHREGFLVEGFLVGSFIVEGARSGEGLGPTARQMEPRRAEVWGLLHGKWSQVGRRSGAYCSAFCISIACY